MQCHICQKSANFSYDEMNRYHHKSAYVFFKCNRCLREHMKANIESNNLTTKLDEMEKINNDLTKKIHDMSKSLNEFYDSYEHLVMNKEKLLHEISSLTEENARLTKINSDLVYKNILLSKNSKVTVNKPKYQETGLKNELHKELKE